MRKFTDLLAPQLEMKDLCSNKKKIFQPDKQIECICGKISIVLTIFLLFTLKILSFTQT